MWIRPSLVNLTICARTLTVEVKLTSISSYFCRSVAEGGAPPSTGWRSSWTEAWWRLTKTSSSPRTPTPPTGSVPASIMWPTWWVTQEKRTLLFLHVLSTWGDTRFLKEFFYTHYQQPIHFTGVSQFSVSLLHCANVISLPIMPLYTCDPPGRISQSERANTQHISHCDVTLRINSSGDFLILHIFKKD